MLQYVNQRKRCHIVTIEDPIEYLFQDDKANINQREVGIDCLSFNEALRALVREDPDIVLVGEMRDYETFEDAWMVQKTKWPVSAARIAASSSEAATAADHKWPLEISTVATPWSGGGCGGCEQGTGGRRGEGEEEGRKAGAEDGRLDQEARRQEDGLTSPFCIVLSCSGRLRAGE